MISNQILQSTIEGIKNISRVELCVADVDGKEIVSTSPMGDCVKAVGEFANSPADSQEIQVPADSCSSIPADNIPEIPEQASGGKKNHRQTEGPSCFDPP